MSRYDGRDLRPMVLQDADYRAPGPVIAGYGSPYPGPSGAPQTTPLRLLLRWKWHILAFSVVATAIAAAIIWRIPPRQFTDHEARLQTEAFIRGEPG